MRAAIKRLLTYTPMPETAEVRRMLERGRVDGRPYCAPWQGDFIFRVITTRGYTRCVETGFGTGSTALHMLEAVGPRGGSVVSIDWSDANFNEIGRRNVAQSRFADRHTLIEEPSWRAMPRVAAEAGAVDFVFIDGWKTFDYLAYELFLLNRALSDGGCIMFDDAHLPSVRRAIAMLKRHYGYDEVDYANFGETAAQRAYHVLTTRGVARSCRAVLKAVPLERQPPTHEWTFYRPF
jgi:predicted O-methyltransferase YrrM